MAQVIIIADHTKREVVNQITVGPDWKLHGVELGRLWMEILESVEEARRLEAKVPAVTWTTEDAIEEIRALEQERAEETQDD